MPWPPVFLSTSRGNTHMSIKKIAEKAGVSIYNRITYPEPAGLQMFSAWPQRKSLGQLLWK